MTGAIDRTTVEDEAPLAGSTPGVAGVLVVMLAIFVISVAAAVAAHLHAGIPAHLAIVFAVGIFCMLLAAHLLFSRPREIPAAKSDKRAPTIQMAASPRMAPDFTRTPGDAKPVELPPEVSNKLAAALGAEAAQRPSAAKLELGEPLAPQARSASIPAAVREPVAMPSPRATPELSLAGDRTSALEEEGRREFGRREPALPQPATSEAAVAEPRRAASEVGPAETAPGPLPPQNIEGILKRMAAQINAGRATSDSVSPPAESPEEHVAPDDAPPPPTVESGDPRKAISVAVGALRAAADEMRSQIKEQSDNNNPPIHARLAEVAEAVSRDQLDIYLDPIIGLDDGLPRHFELTVQARTGDGDSFDPEDFRELTRGSGLMPLLDTSRIRHSAAIAKRLSARISDASVFSTLEGETLDNRRFFSSLELDHADGRMPAALLVLSLRQADMRTFVPAHYQSLRLLRNMGFRFALQDVTDLDMHFEDLAAIGFEFVKLDAEVYLDGMHVGTEKLPASDVCRHLESTGLRIIVDHIQSELQREKVATSGVSYGQGEHFGPPSPIRRASVGAASSTAAA
ncbi:MAG: hypothetical protein RLZ98_1522 [Pseudomonadota bacterium]|jgi:cyclic-di-GMP phosphodiesterase TipF (flagellum assembly factor)